METTTQLDFNTLLQKISLEEIDKHPNILLAAQLWDNERYNAAKVCYKFMRHLDDLVDNRKATGKIINCMEKKQFAQLIEEWLTCLVHPAKNNALFHELNDTIQKFQIPFPVFQEFSKAMLYDVNHNGFETYADFLKYSEGASVAPAAIFVHLCGLIKAEETYIPAKFNSPEVARPCAIFSYLVHIMRDFQKDQLENLNYFANDILLENNLNPVTLQRIAQGEAIPDGFRNMMQFYKNEAEKYRNQTLKMIESIRPLIEPRYMISLELIFELYDLVYHRIDCKKGSFTSAELNPTNEEIKKHIMAFLGRYN